MALHTFLILFLEVTILRAGKTSIKKTTNFTPMPLMSDENSTVK
jgi:hypothetical protein